MPSDFKNSWAFMELIILAERGDEAPWPKVYLTWSRTVNQGHSMPNISRAGLGWQAVWGDKLPMLRALMAEHEGGHPPSVLRKPTVAQAAPLLALTRPNLHRLLEASWCQQFGLSLTFLNVLFSSSQKTKKELYVLEDGALNGIMFEKQIHHMWVIVITIKIKPCS